MRCLCVRRLLPCAFVLPFIGLAALSTNAQTSKKESVWDKIKKSAQQGAQQGQPQQQPQQPSQRQNVPGRPTSQKQPQNQINDSGPFKPPAGTKIEEKILAPLQERAVFEVSPHGVHVATIESDGSRAVVWHDGVEGPKFDEILPQDSNNHIAFSPDGTRYAYCARSGDQYVVMVDGKELLRSNESQGGRCKGQNSGLRFTSNSKHVYYFADMHVLSPADRTYTRFVFDGKPEIPNSRIEGVAFSPDGDHYAYLWNDINGQKPWMLIVDGKVAPYQGGAPVWAADSKHLYTQRTTPPTGSALLLDGKPIARAFSFQVKVPPVGDMVIVSVSGGTREHPYSFLVVDGKKAPGTETAERGEIHDVVFSPDGKHYAAHCENIMTNSHYVVADGKRGQEYSAIDKLAFTADSSTLVYTSMINGKAFVVVGDREFGAPLGSGGNPVIAPSGSRVGSFITINGNPSLMMDGKVAPLNARGGADLSFTPDGAHYAYFAIDQGNGYRLVIDGAPQAQSALSGADKIDLENIVAALKYIFSADSKHVAHFASSGTTRGVFLDGKFIPASQEGTNTKLVFSPDSKHLFWIHQYGNNPYRLFIDGKPLVDFFGAGQNLTIPHWWEFGPDGTLSFLAQDDNSLKRIMIVLSPETSLETMLGGSSGTVAARQ